MKVKKAAKNQLATGYKTPTSLSKLFPVVLLVITAIVFAGSVNNEFTNWDDNVNITGNADIQHFHGDSVAYTVKKAFSFSKESLMYAPITRLSYCCEYEMYGLSPKHYHLDNFILHLINTLLVFYFIWLLGGQQLTAFMTGLLFAVHPMHVEPVAWVTGRIDLLYALFYISALCAYLFYIRSKKNKWIFYLLAFLLFILGDLSKVSMVTLPLVFFAIDYFLDRKVTSKTLLEKAPFLVVSFVFGCLAIYVQKKALSIDDIGHYGSWDKVLFSSYALLMYLWKLVLPVNLSCFYAYPEKSTSMWFSTVKIYPLIFNIAPFIISVIVWVVYKSQKFGKDVVFGFVFFFLNVVLVLPGFASRFTIAADRYTYVAYIGLFFIVTQGLFKLSGSNSEKWKNAKTISTATLTLFVFICCILTIQRCKVWNNSIDLWTDTLEKYDRASMPFNNRGDAYVQSKQYEKGIADLTKGIQLKPDYPYAYYNRGNAYHFLGKYDSAIADFSMVISLDPKYLPAYNNRGYSYDALGKYNESIKDYSSAILLQPNSAETYVNRGYSYNVIGKYTEAIQDYTSALTIKSNFPKAFNNRGNSYYSIKKLDNAIRDYSAAILLDSKYSEAYNNRGISYGALGKYSEAITDFTMALGLNHDFPDPYYNRALALLSLGKYQMALDDAIKAKELGHQVNPDMINAIQANIKKTAVIPVD